MSIQVHSESPRATRHVVSVDAHTLHADASVQSGGGSAPNPHDLFDAALASCKAVTAVLYARHKGFDLERVDVEIVRDDTNERQGTYVLDVSIAFKGDLTEEQRQRLHKVAAKCPIHKLMTTSTVVVNQRQSPAPDSA